MKIKLLFVAFLFLSFQVFSQSLYTPRNVEKAIEAGTRSVNGSPGKNYWQNKGVYDMQISVNPVNALVSGEETIAYSNNSPDTLPFLVIRFVNNVHKPNSPRGSYVSDNFFTNGMTIDSFAVNGQAIAVNAENWGTTGDVRLNSPLLPHSKADVYIKWHYNLSKQDGREGQIDYSTFYVAYSYPRISVYDDYNGWDMIPHTLRQEFYNDFNDYTFSVKVPKNFIVWATGDLLNPDEVLQPSFSSRLKESYTSDSVFHIATLDDLLSDRVTRQNAWNTWKFKATHITDVCFALSDHYVWDASSVVVDKNGRRVSLQAAYNNNASDFKQSVKWQQNSMKFFSNNWPGVPYPFSKMTAFQGHADMEYPMMVNDGTTSNFRFSQLVQDHEIAHTYFPFYMGTNETRYAFMDEGWATTFEYLIGIEEFGKKAADDFYKAFRVSRYIHDPSTEEDQPIITMSSQESGMGYGSNSYGKASLSYLALKDLLGDDLFKKALHYYMDQWHGKHPIPWDYFNAMNTGSGKNLNWFFNNWFFTNNYIDLKLNKVAKEGNEFNLNIQNVGGFAIPFDVVIKKKDGSETRIHKTPSVWEQNQKVISLKVPFVKGATSILLDGNIFMDYTPADNEKNL